MTLATCLLIIYLAGGEAIEFHLAYGNAEKLEEFLHAPESLKEEGIVVPIARPGERSFCHAKGKVFLFFINDSGRISREPFPLPEKKIIILPPTDAVYAVFAKPSKKLKEIKGGEAVQIMRLETKEKEGML